MDSGIANDSNGGISNAGPGAGADNFDNYGSQGRADDSYGADGGVSSGGPNNVQKDFGEGGGEQQNQNQKQGTMEKIKEKLMPGVGGTSGSDEATKNAASFGTDTAGARHGQANADLNRE